LLELHFSTVNYSEGLKRRATCGALALTPKILGGVHCTMRKESPSFSSTFLLDPNYLNGVKGDLGTKLARHEREESVVC
jgi:hypothetical protein